MTADSQVESLYEDLMTISRTAHAAGYYAVAYHALAATLHAAVALHDLHRLMAVEQEAVEQLLWIDDRASAHRLSTHSAQARGTRSHYESLVSQVVGIRGGASGMRAWQRAGHALAARTRAENPQADAVAEILGLT